MENRNYSTEHSVTRAIVSLFLLEIQNLLLKLVLHRDIAIASEVTPKPIAQIAREIGLREDEFEPYGRYKAKISRAIPKSNANFGKYVYVCGITPTPLGEGKSTVVIGLAQAFGAHLKKPSIACIRQPSQGPTFGIKASVIHIFKTHKTHELNPTWF